MKKTIKDDKLRKVIEEKFITDNALLECVLEDEKVTIGVRYINGQKIHEMILLKISLEDYIERGVSSFLEISEDKNTIATFKRIGEDYQLDKVYEIMEDSCVIDEFKDVAYALTFPNQKLNKKLIKQKTNNEKL